MNDTIKDASRIAKNYEAKSAFLNQADQSPSIQSLRERQEAAYRTHFSALYDHAVKTGDENIVSATDFVIEFLNSVGLDGEGLWVEFNSQGFINDLDAEDLQEKRMYI